MKSRWPLWIGFLAFALFIVVLFDQMAAPTKTGHEEHETTGEHPAAHEPPATWGEFRRTALVKGTSALAEFDRLHGKAIQVKDGWRADYAGSTAKFTVWAAMTATDREAQQLEDEMTRAIGGNNKMFSRPQALRTAQGVTAWRSEGMGQVHFYYVKGTALYWVAISGPDPEGLLARLVTGL